LAGDGLIDRVTVCVPFYRQPLILAHQLKVWASYDDETLERFEFIVVDDGSPEEAESVIYEHADPERLMGRLSLYRIGVDIPWNRGMARNLSSHVAETEWVVHVDIDHVLPPESAKALLKADCDPGSWYRFRRFRVGKADETRQKDFKKVGLPDGAEFGEIEPHIDSYLVTRDLYWKSGGYDEDYAGMLGGGSPFLAELTKVGGKPKRLPNDVHLEVYTRHAIPDASVLTLDRDTSRYSALRKRKESEGRTRVVNPLRQPWSRVL
jgi:glycosyltransferase involved in cell wall biosynthesis